MKKFIAFLFIGVLTACSYSENSVNFLPFRNKAFTFWQTESIFYYDQGANEEFLSESQTITEDKIEKGVVLITHTGEIMTSSKTYRTDYYSTETVKPTKNGELSSAYTPLKLSKKANYNAFGEVKYKGETYMLVRENKKNDIILVDGDGEIYDHIGRIVDGRLAVLSAKFYTRPADLRMVPVVNTRTEISEDSEGYTLVYNGLANNGDEIVFIYKTVGQEDEELRFSICDEEISIHGIDIDIFDASEDKIEYMIK